MINAITPAIATNSQATRRNKQQNFGMAYRIDNRWNETFDAIQENNFIFDLVKKVRNGQVKYVGSDGISQHFRGVDGDIYFTKETKQMMGNVKFVPKNSSEDGFYIINNGRSNDGNYFEYLSNQFSKITRKAFNEPLPNRRRVAHISSHTAKSVPVAYYYVK